MSDDDIPLPADDRGNLADINWDDVHLPDDDLWLLLTGRSVPPQLEAGDKVSPKWVAWAKETIRDVSFVPARYERNAEGMGRDDALALYLCRLMRIVDMMAESAGPVGKPSMELENLLSSAAEAAWLEVDLRRLEGSWEGTDDVLRHACEAGLVQSVKAGGGPALYSLTLLGRRRADGGSVGPPPFRWSVQQDLDAAQADAWDSLGTDPGPPSATDALPEGGSGERLTGSDVPAEQGTPEAPPTRDSVPTAPAPTGAAGCAPGDMDGGLAHSSVGSDPASADAGDGGVVPSWQGAPELTNPAGVWAALQKTMGAIQAKLDKMAAGAVGKAERSGEADSEPSGGRRGPDRMPLEEAWRRVAILAEWAGIHEANKQKRERDRYRKIQHAAKHGIDERELNAMAAWYRKLRNAGRVPKDPRTISKGELGKWFA